MHMQWFLLKICKYCMFRYLLLICPVLSKAHISMSAWVTDFSSMLNELNFLHLLWMFMDFDWVPSMSCVQRLKMSFYSTRSQHGCFSSFVKVSRSVMSSLLCLNLIIGCIQSDFWAVEQASKSLGIKGVFSDFGDWAKGVSVFISFILNQPLTIFLSMLKGVSVCCRSLVTVIVMDSGTGAVQWRTCQ